MTSANATNWNNEPVLFTGLWVDWKQSATVNTSPALTVAAAPAPVMAMVVAPSAVIAAEVVPPVAVREPVVNCLMDCDILISSKPSTPVPIMPFLNCLLIVSVGLNRPLAFDQTSVSCWAGGVTWRHHRSVFVQLLLCSKKNCQRSAGSCAGRADRVTDGCIRVCNVSVDAGSKLRDRGWRTLCEIVKLHGHSSRCEVAPMCSGWQLAAL